MNVFTRMMLMWRSWNIGVIFYKMNPTNRKFELLLIFFLIFFFFSFSYLFSSWLMPFVLLSFYDSRWISTGIFWRRFALEDLKETLTLTTYARDFQGDMCPPYRQGICHLEIPGQCGPGFLAKSLFFYLFIIADEYQQEFAGEDLLGKILREP